MEPMLFSLLALAAPIDTPLVLPAAEGVRVELVEPPVGTAVFVDDRELVGLAYRPDRLATAQGHLAFVSSITGLASVWVVPLDGSSEPRQLTNVALRKDRSDFVAPPAHPPRFRGAFLLWRDGAGGMHRVRWR